MKNKIGQLVVVRCYYAGVWVGTLNAIDTETNKVELTNAHRLWSWTAKDGFSLSEVANNGVKGGKISKPVESVWLNNNDCYEVASMKSEAYETVKELSK